MKNKIKVNLFSKILSLIFSMVAFSPKKLNITHHNGESIFTYPEKIWNLVPFPKQKGTPFVADNLATVNRHSFISNKKFQDSKRAAESRWNSTVAPRDISWRLHIFLWAFGQNLSHKNIKNSIFVECGTGKGYMAAGACSHFRFNSNSPDLYLVDRYEDTPVDFTKSSKNTPNSFKTVDAYSNNVKEVEEYFSTYSSVKILKGLIPDILEKIPSKPILFLHIDLNSAQPEKEALEILSQNFAPGTVILFDDYGGPGIQLQAEVHERFAFKNKKEILTLPTGQAVIVW